MIKNINMKKEVICSNGKYRIIKISNKYIVQEAKTFMKVWTNVKVYPYYVNSAEDIVKHNAYVFYLRLLDK